MATLFFSYSHADETQRDQLQKHFSVLRREGILETWHDRRLLPGDKFDDGISEKLEAADIILFLVSPDFLDSDYCYEIEMKRALERHEAGDARAVSIILEQCDWKSTPLSRFLVLPRDGKSVSKYPNHNDAFFEIVTEIRRLLSAMETTPAIDVSSHKPEATRTVINATTPRSSNLAVRQEFTDRDRDRFLLDSFDYVKNFFEGSLNELEARNEGIETEFQMIDANHFTAEIYRGGNRESSCTISRPGHGLTGRHSLTFTTNTQRYQNSFEDALSLVEGEHELGFLPLDGFMRGSQRERTDKGLSMQGAAEHFWSRLMQPLQ